jgi:hypothetical protein
VSDERITEENAGHHIVSTRRRSGSAGDEYSTTIYYGLTAISGDRYHSLAEARLGHAAWVEKCQRWAEAEGTKP